MRSAERGGVRVVIVVVVVVGSRVALVAGAAPRLVVSEPVLRRARRRVRARGADPCLLRVALAREHRELVPLRPEELV
jgi:hypothetical protein